MLLEEATICAGYQIYNSHFGFFSSTFNVIVAKLKYSFSNFKFSEELL